VIVDDELLFLVGSVLLRLAAARSSLPRSCRVIESSWRLPPVLDDDCCIASNAPAPEAAPNGKTTLLLLTDIKTTLMSDVPSFTFL
jgi:hypothetical protein